MISSKRHETRKPSARREETILTALRQRIVAGEFPPGARLPIRVELERQFNAAPHTMQRVMTRLARDGFVVARGKRGTFVVERPPHLHQYGLVMGFDLADASFESWAKLPVFFYREAMAWRKLRGLSIPTYPNVDGHAETDGYRRLRNDVQAQRLAGLIFDWPKHLDSPLLAGLLDTPGLPCVSIGGGITHTNLTVVGFQYEAFVGRSLDYLQTRGHSKVALLTASNNDGNFQYFTQGIASRAMTTQPYWLQGVPPQTARLARNVVLLLLQGREVPDALLISDDSLVEDATSALCDAGVRVPEDIEVVAHANFPYTTPSRVPAKRIGFDVREMLQTCLDLIDRRRRDEKVPEFVTIAPAFMEEVNGVVGGVTAEILRNTLSASLSARQV